MSRSSSKQSRYLRAKAIAHEALDRSGQARLDHLDAACAGDTDLRAEVEWLIEAVEDSRHDDVPERFQAATRETLGEVSLEVPLPRNYRLIRRLGHGGMGIVYLAEREDGDLRQRVALKLLQLSALPDDLAIRRLQAERQVLSRLDHPSIAHLIDGGMTADGRPFIATEFVSGQAVDAWCRRNGVDRGRILELFITICEAVDHAHRRMVIHRDLKPSNILVTEDGLPKLLDFGIARLRDADAGGEPGAEQAEGLTLAYASPEQVAGRDLGPGSDIYSLGVLLQLLLTGQHPFQDIESQAALRAAVLEGAWSPTARRAFRALPTDLRAITARATRVDEEARYRSAADLAEDLRRFRAHRPVSARRQTAIYRFLRFARRQRLAMAASAGVLALVAAFLWDREAKLQRIAEERDRAEAVTGFMNELFESAEALPATGESLTVRSLLDLGARNLAANDAPDGETLGSIHRTIGQAYNALGLGEEALPLLRRARSALAGELAPREQARLQAAIGAALDSAGRAVEAIAADGEALAMYAGLAQAPRDEVLQVRIRMLRNHANVRDRPLASTIADLRAVTDELERRPVAGGELLFEARASLVGALVAAGEAAAANAMAEVVLQQSERLYPPGDPRRLRGRHVHATARMLSDPQAAIALFEPLVAEQERLIGPSQRLANTVGNLGVALSRVGRHDAALEAFARAAAIIDRTVGRDHYLYRLSITNQAAMQLRIDQPESAERLIRGILPDLERRRDRFGGVETLYWASAMDVLGTSLARQMRLEEAESAYRDAVAALQAGDRTDWRGVLERVERKLRDVRLAQAEA
jgi:serine/threonine-protein kinase